MQVEMEAAAAAGEQAGALSIGAPKRAPSHEMGASASKSAVDLFESSFASVQKHRSESHSTRPRRARGPFVTMATSTPESSPQDLIP